MTTLLLRRIRTIAFVLSAFFCSNAIQAQELELIEQRLGAIVADGELTLEQAMVMMGALREFSHGRHHDDELQRHFERLGISGQSVQQAKRALSKHGVHDHQLQQATEALLRISQLPRNEDNRFEIPKEVHRHLLEELKLSEPQVKLLGDLARRLVHESESKRMVQWIESIESKLKSVVEADKLSEKDAWKKWDWYKEHEIGPKIESALQSKMLTEEQAEHLWGEIKQREKAHRKAK